MKKLLVLSALGLSLGASTVALAANGGVHVQAVKGGVYVGGGLGIGGMNTPRGYLPLDNATSKSYKLRSGVVYRVDVGYLFPVAAHLLLGVEGGYTGYPHNKYRMANNIQDQYCHLNYRGHLFDLLAVAKYYFGGRFNVFAKVGGADVYQKTALTLYNGGNHSKVAFTKKVSKILPEAALGVGYDITPAIGVDVTYSHVFGVKPSFNVAHIQDIKDLEPHLSKVASVNTLIGGVTFKFNV